MDKNCEWPSEPTTTKPLVSSTAVDSEHTVTVHVLGQGPKKVSCRSSDRIHVLKQKVASEYGCEYNCSEGISCAQEGEKLPCLCDARGTALVNYGRERAMRLPKEEFALRDVNSMEEDSQWKKFVKSDEETCSLCLSVFGLDPPPVRADLKQFITGESQIVIGECGHAFHECCLLSHFKSASKLSCPICNCGFKYVNEGAKLMMTDTGAELTDNGAVEGDTNKIKVVTKELEEGASESWNIELEENDTAGAVKKRVMNLISIDEGEAHKYCLSGSDGIFFDDDKITSLSSYPPLFALCGTSGHNCCKSVAYEVAGEEVPRDADGMEVSKGLRKKLKVKPFNSLRRFFRLHFNFPCQSTN